MGGDFAPYQTINGIINAALELSEYDKLFLFGKEKLILNSLSKHKIGLDRFEIIDCSQTIDMSDDPVRSFREKSDSEIVIGFDYLKKGKIDSFASAGNTGAMMVGATQIIGVANGIIRPGISSFYPNNKGKNNLILDVGLNPETKADVLVQYAQIGSLFAKHLMQLENPKIGLLNIGEEESKGTTNVKQAYQLLKEVNDINFIGNIEGGDMYNANIVDVIVCNGFTGNIVLKQAESFYEIINQRNIQDSYFDNYNYENYGGTPILGVKHPVIVGHGKSSDLAIKNMVLASKRMFESGISEIITKHFSHDTN